MFFAAGRSTAWPPTSSPSREIGICPDCRRLLVTDESLLCPCCGEIGDIPADGSRCADCRNQRAAFERLITLGPYAGYLRSRILLMKTEKSGYTAEAMARLIWAARSETLRQS
ncbi:MAG: hypothetical protein J6S27_07430, partial [Thermoguttaceae bacterium]|nr:hypothetical protein [Thermoguttaceae bacterium]